jgi:hypothetical protein
MTTTEIHPNQTPIGGFGLSVNGSDQNGTKLVFGKRPLIFNQAAGARATTTGAISRHGPSRLCCQYLRPLRRLALAAPSQEGETVNHETATTVPARRFWTMHGRDDAVDIGDCHAARIRCHAKKAPNKTAPRNKLDARSRRGPRRRPRACGSRRWTSG